MDSPLIADLDKLVARLVLGKLLESYVIIFFCFSLTQEKLKDPVIFHFNLAFSCRLSGQTESSQSFQAIL